MPKGNPRGCGPGSVGPLGVAAPMPPPPGGCPHEGVPGAPTFEVTEAVVEVGEVTLVLMLLFEAIAAAAIAAMPAAKNEAEV